MLSRVRMSRAPFCYHQDFSTRRSFLAYQFAGIPLQIKIFPTACFTEYEL